MTPMFAVSPLSPERARHKRINGTRTLRSEDTCFISHDDLLPDGRAIHERRPERHDFGRLRPPLVHDVRDTRNAAEYARHQVRREARVDLALVLIAHSKLHEHFSR